MGVPVLGSLDEPSEGKVLEEECFVLVKQVIQIDPVSVHEVAFDKDFLVANVDKGVAQQDPGEAKQRHTFLVHKTVPQQVVGHLEREVKSSDWQETHSLRHVIEAHDLLQDVQLAVEGQVLVELCPHDVDELVKGWVEEDLKLLLDL